MIRLTYISTARAPIGEATTETILAASRRNNRRDAISGLLLFDGVRFLQALEGDPARVAATYDRIRADSRHLGCVELDRREIGERAFAGWDMAWRRVSPAGEGATLAETVDRLVAEVPDANTRALFSSFARIDRTRA